MNPTTGWQILTHTDSDEIGSQTIISARLPGQNHHFEFWKAFEFKRRGLRATYEQQVKALTTLLQRIDARVAAGAWAPNPAYWTRVEHSDGLDERYYADLRDPDLEP